ncbi:MAG: hypothetical protein LBP52_00370 [Burkholderiaceae bacterium]|jgi:hypothetical protein|nr:hypothetical protein [Burkholderiaceae bacterium]
MDCRVAALPRNDDAMGCGRNDGQRVRISSLLSPPWASAMHLYFPLAPLGERVRVRGIFPRNATEKGIAQMKATWIAASLRSPQWRWKGGMRLQACAAILLPAPQRHPQKSARIHAALALGQRNVFRAG